MKTLFVMPSPESATKHDIFKCAACKTLQQGPGRCSCGGITYNVTEDDYREQRKNLMRIAECEAIGWLTGLAATMRNEDLPYETRQHVVLAALLEAADRFEQAFQQYGGVI